ncbi:LysR substrate-binding domain-containing protein [Paraburkholderia sp. D15]|uniref:LysR substrate-binding domain-containing protein n=1 Tax=Paraburkholderia sp. D15 TaxID=2880218 RepID=UPI002478FB41|nr:LysR substrate-binding domain-containing protein [Paraburkholderia sp. D15]WGS54689.1 LysR substrate-binding domain-containing protein [Paraburkholderia sp. D15]
MPVAQRTLAELESAVRDIGDMSDVENRRATVAVTPAMAAGILPAVLTSIANAYPHIEIHMKEADSSQIIALIDSGEVDLGVDAVVKSSPGITREVVGTFDMVYVCRDEFREVRFGGTAFSAEMDWADIPAAPLIGMSAGNPMQQIIDQRLMDLGRAIVQREAFSHLLTIVALVEAGHGAAILPAFVLPMCARFSVQATHLRRPSDSIDVYVARKSGRTNSEICTIFTEAVTLKLRSLVNAAAPG